jgi:signal transduction histidine kinase
VDRRTEDIRIAMQVLRHEFSERRRLEEEILNIGERAQARIGQDLHDDLGQQLVGMTILMELLSSQLGAESHPRATEAARLEAFLSDSINTTRNLAKSLYPVELERGGLILSLQDLANRTEMMAGITCTVTADKDFQFEKTAEIHLYRIVQESISNALKHGNARNIEIACTARDGVSTLTVTDDGSGFIHPDSEQGVGIGLHLFQYRARLIGARITVARGANGGCRVTCSMENPSLAPL